MEEVSKYKTLIRTTIFSTPRQFFQDVLWAVANCHMFELPYDKFNDSALRLSKFGDYNRDFWVAKIISIYGDDSCWENMGNSVYVANLYAILNAYVNNAKFKVNFTTSTGGMGARIGVIVTYSMLDDTDNNECLFAEMEVDSPWKK